MKKVLIIGFGIGQLYKKVIVETKSKVKYEVITIDPDKDKKADFLDLESCYKLHPHFDLAIICCPNYLHESYVLKLHERKMADTILVEKPGLEDLAAWILCSNTVSPNKLVVVKNNMYRKDMYEKIKTTIENNQYDISEIKIDWLNQNRVPNPGSWFTNEKLAWGGVSRDLMPHLLSIYYSIFEECSYPYAQGSVRKYELKDVISTDYGKVAKENAIYDVDDNAIIGFSKKIGAKEIPVTLNACWKHDGETKIGVTIIINDHHIFYDFGLCPEEAYRRMIVNTLNMKATEYKKHRLIDEWMHVILDNF